MFDLIGFDGDDTLWESESDFAVTQELLADLLAPYTDPQTLTRTLLATEQRNLELFGYGVKGFTLSMIETAIEVSDGRVAAEQIRTIVGWGKQMLAGPVRVLDGVEEVLGAVGQDHRVVLVTKGDLFHQESKLARSGLGDRFDHVEVVAEKDRGTYRGLLRRLGVEPQRFLMVGNSLRSDVLPVVAIGGWAVHVPHDVTWAHEAADPPTGDAAERHRHLDRIGDLPGLLAGLR